jgi:hypothetical protein
MKKFRSLFFVLVLAVLLFAVLRTKRSNVHNLTPQKNTEASVDQIKEPAWWAGIWQVPEKEWIFSFFRVRASLTQADAIFLEQVVEQRNGLELQRAASMLASMLRGRYPVIAPRHELLATKLRSLAANEYPEKETRTVCIDRPHLRGP